MGFLDKLQKLWNPPEDEYEEYEEEDVQQEEEQEVKQPEPTRAPVYESEFPSRRAAQAPTQSAGKVVNLQSAPQMRVALFKPTTFGDETRTIADELTSMHTVVLNLESTERSVSRRVIDFLSGVAYAQNGHIKRVSTGTFIITPNNVDFGGENLLIEDEDGLGESIL